jgi:hypothetical protein
MSRRLFVLGVVVALLVVAFLMPIASGKNLDYMAPLSHAQEVGDVNAPGAGGSAEFSLDGSTLHYRVTVRHLTGPAVMAHIHWPAGRGVDTGIQVWLCGTTAFAGPAGTPTCSTTIDGVLVEGSVVLTMDQLSMLVSVLDAGLGYTNVHTALHLPGEVRGQVLPVGNG